MRYDVLEDQLRLAISTYKEQWDRKAFRTRDAFAVTEVVGSFFYSFWRRYEPEFKDTHPPVGSVRLVRDVHGYFHVASFNIAKNVNIMSNGAPVVVREPTWNICEIPSRNYTTHGIRLEGVAAYSNLAPHEFFPASLLE